VNIEINEQIIADEIIKELRKHQILNSNQIESQNVTVIYNAEVKDVLYTVAEVAEIIKTNQDYVHKLRKAGLLQFLKLGSYKCRRSSLLKFLEEYEGKDLTDPFDIHDLSS
jgi:hypothetical protein